MKTKETWIMGVRISNRTHDVAAVQSILTTFGCSIRTRLGLHEIDEAGIEPGGILLLELSGDETEFLKLENALLNLDGVTVKKMIL